MAELEKNESVKFTVPVFCTKARLTGIIGEITLDVVLCGGPMPKLGAILGLGARHWSKSVGGNRFEARRMDGTRALSCSS